MFDRETLILDRESRIQRIGSRGDLFTIDSELTITKNGGGCFISSSLVGTPCGRRWKQKTSELSRFVVSNTFLATEIRFFFH